MSEFEDDRNEADTAVVGRFGLLDILIVSLSFVTALILSGADKLAKLVMSKARGSP